MAALDNCRKWISLAATVSLITAAAVAARGQDRHNIGSASKPHGELVVEAAKAHQEKRPPIWDSL